MHSIARRIRKGGKKEASKIVVDQQSQFNKAQKTLAEYFAQIRGIPMINGPGLPAINFSSMPTTPISFSSSAQSPGLELVDVHLWVFKRAMERKELAPELYGLITPQLHRGRTDEISLKALSVKWARWFKELPPPTTEQMENAKELLAFDEERRLRALREDA